LARRRSESRGADILVQSRRDGGAAKRFFKRLLKGLRVLLPDTEHRESRYLNNHADTRRAANGKGAAEAELSLGLHAQGAIW
jgi:transposase-like protein